MNSNDKVGPAEIAHWLFRIGEKTGPLNEILVRSFARQLLLGLRSLHAAGIAHRDIKCQNLLLTDDNVVKLADFGSAKKVKNRSMQATANNATVGSVLWMAPEILQNGVYTAAADVYSFGVVLGEMLSGEVPWL